MTIINPILPGFHPDPSVCRVGHDYYIVNSTFEWFPGVPVHHSRDLRHWRLIGHVLTERRLLDLRGVGDSAGVWAPSLSHADGRFWLVYSNVVQTGGGRPFKDIRIFITTATDILGPWSDPVRMDAVGFDPSIFHDADGTKHLVNIEWDFRKGRNRFAGIVIQQFDPTTLRLLGNRTRIFEMPGKLIEGPNLYRRDGWYFLMLAEGGTGWNHGISAARSRNLLGPYEADPLGSVMTTRDTPDWPLQKAGHGELVETPTGETFLVHLAGRPVGERRCVLGRETCIQRVRWEDDWIRLEHGGVLPALELAGPAGLADHAWPPPPTRDDFDVSALDPAWSSLRVPIDHSWASLTVRPGWLRLKGRDSLHSLFEQSLLARRLTSVRCTVETRMNFRPAGYHQCAGLVLYYDTRSHYYLRVTRDEEQGVVIGVVATDDGVYEEYGDIAIGDWSVVHLRAEIADDTLRFYASPGGVQWIPVGPELDATRISDDYGSTLRFTGAMIGICCQDLAGDGGFADFDHFQVSDYP
jgi:xylan 1,4-beta-xylosidase